jgi:hypothetical protein
MKDLDKSVIDDSFYSVNEDNQDDSNIFLDKEDGGINDTHDESNIFLDKEAGEIDEDDSILSVVVDSSMDYDVSDVLTGKDMMETPLAGREALGVHVEETPKPSLLSSAYAATMVSS